MYLCSNTKSPSTIAKGEKPPLRKQWPKFKKGHVREAPPEKHWSLYF